MEPQTIRPATMNIGSAQSPSGLTPTGQWHAIQHRRGRSRTAREPKDRRKGPRCCHGAKPQQKAKAVYGSRKR